jgi:hypothetical protein
MILLLVRTPRVVVTRELGDHPDDADRVLETVALGQRTADAASGMDENCGGVERGDQSLTNIDTIANLGNFLPLPKLYVSTTQLRNDLIHCVSVLLHR